MDQVFQRDRVQRFGAQGEALVDRTGRQPRVDVFGRHDLRFWRSRRQAGRGIFGRQQLDQLAFRVCQRRFDRMNTPDPDS